MRKSLYTVKGLGGATYKLAVKKGEQLQKKSNKVTANIIKEDEKSLKLKKESNIIKKKQNKEESATTILLRSANIKMAKFDSVLEDTNRGWEMLGAIAAGVTLPSIQTGVSGTSLSSVGNMHQFEPLRDNQVAPEKGYKHLWKGIKSVGKELKKFGGGIGTAVSGVSGFLDVIGVLEPIMKIISPIFEIIGGAVLQALMPALQVLIDAISDPSFIAFLVKIGEIIGVFLAPIIEAIVPIFMHLIKALEPLMPMIKILAWILGNVLAIAMGIIANVIIGIVNFIILVINAMGWLFGAAPIASVEYMAIPTPTPMPSYDLGGIALNKQIAQVDKGEKMIPLERQEKEDKRNNRMVFLLEDIAATNQRILANKEWRHRGM